jgi:hypothetical protein
MVSFESCSARLLGDCEDDVPDDELRRRIVLCIELPLGDWRSGQEENRGAGGMSDLESVREPDGATKGETNVEASEAASEGPTISASGWERE